MYDCKTCPQNFAGCEQVEVFQSVVNPDKLALLERWTDQAALDAHARLHSTLPPFKPELCAGATECEYYTCNRTRSAGFRLLNCAFDIG